MWRYKELLPVAGEVTVGFHVGYTPLIKADRLARALGVRELWIKNDTVNYPTLSFKDRVVSVALSRAKEFGFEVVACASTGNPLRVPVEAVLVVLDDESNRHGGSSLRTAVFRPVCGESA